MKTKNLQLKNILFFLMMAGLMPAFGQNNFPAGKSKFSFSPKTPTEANATKNAEASSRTRSFQPAERLVFSWDAKWDTAGQETFTYYPANGLVKEKNLQVYDGEGGFFTAYRNSYTYNGNNRLIEDKGEYWDMFSNTWMPDTRLVNAYDQHDNLTLSLTLAWDWVSSWDTLDGVKRAFNYHPSGEYYDLTIKFWNNGAWMENNKEVNTFDSNGHLETLTFYADFGGGLEPSYMEEFQVDQNGVITSATGYAWTGSNWELEYLIADIIWQDFSKKTMKEFKEFGWDGTSFYPFGKFKSTYNAAGKQVLSIYEIFDGSDWYPYNVITTTYDQNENETELTFEYWNGSSLALFFGSRKEFTYNGINEPLVEIHSFYDYFNTQSWEKQQKYVYPDATTGIAVSANVKKTNIYPNPFLSAITIENVENKNIEVLDITGKTVYAAKPVNTQNMVIDLSNLDAGVYFVRAYGKNGEAMVNKVIKK